MSRRCFAGNILFRGFRRAGVEEHPLEALISIAIFVGFGLVFVFGNLLLSMIVRPSAPSALKKSVYECGEPTVGPGWVQFDLRFYIVALFYLVFDVEVALTYPWAVVFRDFPTPALVLGLPFIALVVIGFAYEWYSGSLDWVRSSMNTSAPLTPVSPTGGAAADLAAAARVDPEVREDRRI